MIWNFRTKRLCLLTVLLVGWFQFAQADPAPAKTEYLRTFTGGFTYKRLQHCWVMFIIVQPIKQAPGGGALYLEAVFENPQQGQAPLTRSMSTLEADKLGVYLEVSPVVGMRDRRGYKVAVYSYADSKHTKLLSVHKQMMVYHDVGDPEALLQRLNANRHHT